MNSENPYAPSQVEEFKPSRGLDSIPRKLVYICLVILVLHSMSLFSPILTFPLLEPGRTDGYAERNREAFVRGQQMLFFLKIFPFVAVGLILGVRIKLVKVVLAITGCFVTALLIANHIKANHNLIKINSSFYFELASIFILTILCIYSHNFYANRKLTTS